MEFCRLFTLICAFRIGLQHVLRQTLEIIFRVQCNTGLLDVFLDENRERLKIGVVLQAQHKLIFWHEFLLVGLWAD